MNIIFSAIITLMILVAGVWRISGQINQLQGLSPQRPSLRDYLSVNETHVRNVAHLVTLNQLRPDFQALSFLQQGQKTDFTEVRRYYRKIIEYYPQMPGAYTILGLCDYWDGNREQAIKTLQAGYEIDPNFFWFSYNLGAICLQNGDLYHAKIFFRHALQTPFRTTLEKMYLSQLYRQIFSVFRLTQEQITQGLDQAYADCQRGLGLVLLFEKEPALLNPDRPDFPRPKIF